MKRFGHLQSKETRLKISRKLKGNKHGFQTGHKRNIGVKNPAWKGDKVGYTSLHRWVKKFLKKPILCDNCKLKKAFDLANKGIYNRNIKNWEWLCRRCHMLKDGRIYKNLIQYQ